MKDNNNINKEQAIISKAIIDRMPIYYRTLKQMRAEGIEIVSSEEIGRINGITPEQIRKDLSTFGGFGKKGIGYYVEELMNNIAEILGLTQKWNIVIVGIGHLGWALANYRNFSLQNFYLQAIFDVDSEKVGKYIDDIKIYHVDDIEKTVAEKNIQIAIITTPAEEAQAVADMLIKAGVKGIWNFAPVKVVASDDVHIINEDLSAGLSRISYYLSN
jgi:redox-sensing transcriptional repressor